MTRLCRLWLEAPDRIEADLSRFHGYRTAAPPVPPYSFAEVAVRLRYLPDDAATVMFFNDIDRPWTVEADLLEDIRMASYGAIGHRAEPHPASPVAATVRAQKEAEAAEHELRAADVRRRMREQDNREG